MLFLLHRVSHGQHPLEYYGKLCVLNSADLDNEITATLCDLRSVIPEVYCLTYFKWITLHGRV